MFESDKNDFQSSNMSLTHKHPLYVVQGYTCAHFSYIIVWAAVLPVVGTTV